ncbi:MAG: insulinase family protein [Bacteroidales bacterium]|nr:insulinase family protein [Candidatus Cacconaster merdequi]
MKKTFFLLCALLAASLFAYAQYEPQMPLPMNPDLKVGKLQNGLTYYILHNEEPTQRADFYIIYSVGALQETDEQNGLAHFLEHMAFNGTKNFPGGNTEPTSIVKTLERHALAFGRNINAYTTYDRTVYHLDAVPTTDEKLIDTCLLVLHDWAHYVSLEGDEIDNERGVISEEWRTRNNSQARVRKQWFPAIFGDTKYSTHDVIGDYDIINNFKYDELRQFYYDWYRTDQQAVAVVGDVDVDQIEKKIQEVFSSIPAVENPKQKETIVLPENEEPVYVLATDKEETRMSVQLMMLSKASDDQTVGVMRSRIIDEFYKGMLSQRITEKTSKGTPTMLGGGASNSSFLPGYDAYSIIVSPKSGMECKSLETVYTEVVRARRHGFLQSELDRTKTDLLTKLENEYKQKDKISNSQIIGEIVKLFVYGDVTMKMDDYYAIRKALINEISLNEVNTVAAGYPTFKNVKCVVTGPSEGWDAPTKEDIWNVFAKVDADQTIAPFEEEKLADRLIDFEIVPGKVIKEKVLPVFGAKQWTLSNGAKVVYAKADYDKDLINFSAYSFGGTSLYSDDEVKTVDMAGTFGGTLGTSNFPGDKLDKFLKGKKVKLNAKVGHFDEELSGESNQADFETMMQLAYLKFVDPCFDEPYFKNIADRYATLFDMIGKGPSGAMSDSLVAIVSNYNKRAESAKPEDMRALDIKDVEKYFKERISDASDFTFFIIGDIDEDVVRPMVEKYIASIPSEYRKEKWVNDNVDMPKGHNERKVHIPFETPKATVVLVYNTKMKVTQKAKLTFGVMNSILRTRYIANIREKEGGTYSVQCKYSTSNIPVQEGTFIVQFETAPEKAEHLKSLVIAEIKNLIENGVTEEEIANVVKNTLKERDQLKSKNSFVVSSVDKYVKEGINNTIPENYEDILNNMTSAQIQKFAKKFFKNSDSMEIIFSSEKEN